MFFVLMYDSSFFVYIFLQNYVLLSFARTDYMFSILGHTLCDFCVMFVICEKFYRQYCDLVLAAFS